MIPGFSRTGKWEQKVTVHPRLSEQAKLNLKTGRSDMPENWINEDNLGRSIYLNLLLKSPSKWINYLDNGLGNDPGGGGGLRYEMDGDARRLA